MAKADPKLLEMAEVFHIPMAARLKYIILPARMPGMSRLFHKEKSRAGEKRGSNPPEGGTS